MNCYNKHYRFFAYANSLYTYIIAGERVDDHLRDNYDDFAGLDPAEAINPPLSKPSSIPVANKLRWEYLITSF